MGPAVTTAVSSRLCTPPRTVPGPGEWSLGMGWHRLRLEPLKTDASKIVVMIDGMSGGTIAEEVGEMIAAVIAITVTIAETTEEMLGVNLMRIAETLLCVSRPRLPLRAKEQGTTIEMATCLKMLCT